MSKVVPIQLADDPHMEGVYKALDAMRERVGPERGVAVALIMVSRDGAVSTNYQADANRVALIGGLEVLKHRIMEDRG